MKLNKKSILQCLTEIEIEEHNREIDTILFEAEKFAKFGVITITQTMNEEMIIDYYYQNEFTIASQQCDFKNGVDFVLGENSLQEIAYGNDSETNIKYLFVNEKGNKKVEEIIEANGDFNIEIEFLYSEFNESDFLDMSDLENKLLIKKIQNNLVYEDKVEEIHELSKYGIIVRNKNNENKDEDKITFYESLDYINFTTNELNNTSIYFLNEYGRDKIERAINIEENCTLENDYLSLYFNKDDFFSIEEIEKILSGNNKTKKVYWRKYQQQVKINNTKDKRYLLC